VTEQLIEHGLILMFALIAMESAGIPLPGETALIAGAVLASQGHYSIVAVIAVGALAAIVGDNVGYWIGRKGGRALLRRTPIVSGYFDRALPPSERFFQKHGAKTVFFGRFIAILRVTAAWIAGISHMPWWRFLMWNAAGGIVWAILVGTVAYVFGNAVAEAISRYGVIAAVVAIVGGVLVLIGVRVWHRRAVEEA
jgi:membrane protein DedA with SNARE-associated domain